MLGKIKFGFKLVSLFAATSLILMFIFAVLVLSSEYPQRYVKSFLLSQIEKNGYGLTFQRVSGNLFSELTLSEVKGYPNANDKNTLLFEVRELTIQYNLLELLVHHDALYEIAEIITIRDINVYLTRDSKGKWLSFSSNKKAKKNVDLNYSGLIRIQNLTLFYNDYKGWKDHTVSEHFTDNIKDIDGVISFKESSIGQIDLKGRVNSSGEPIKIGGFFDPKSASFLIDFESKKMDLNHWVNYVLPQRDYSVKSGKADVKGFIANKAYTSKNSPPFWLNIVFNFYDTRLKTPYFDQEIEQLKGVVQLSSGHISNSYIKSLRGDISLEKHDRIITYLKQNSVINFKSLLQSDSTKALNKNLSFLDNKEFLVLKTMIQNPPFVIGFQQIEGILASINVMLDGTLNTSEEWVELTMKSPSFQMVQLTQLYPEISFLSPSGNSSLEVDVVGTLDSPILKGVLKGSSFLLAQIPLENVESELTLINGILRIKSKNKHVYSSLISSDVSVDLNSEQAFIEGASYLSYVPPSIFIDSDFIDVTGSIDLSLKFKGTEDLIQGNALAIASESVFFKQQFNRIESEFSLRSRYLVVENSHCYINGSVIPILATAQEHQAHYDVQVSANAVPLSDLFVRDDKAESLLFLNGDIVVPKTKNNEVDSENAVMKLLFSVQNPRLYGVDYSTLKAEVSGRLAELDVQDLQLITERGVLIIDGEFNRDEPVDMIAKLENFSLSNMSFLSNSHVSLNPIEANLSGEFSLHYLGNAQYSATFNLELADVFVSGYKADSLKIKGRFDKDTLFFDAVNIAYKTSHLEFDGWLDFTNQFELSLKPSSEIYLEDLQAFFESKKAMTGALKLNGVLKKEQDAISYDGQIVSDQFKLGSVSVKNFILDAFLSKEYSLLRSFSSDIGEGKFLLSGTQKNDSEGSDFAYDLAITRLSLQDFVSLYDHIEDVLTRQKEKIIDQIEFKKSFSIKTPDFKNDPIPIYASDRSGTVLTYLKEMTTLPQDTAVEEGFSYFQGGFLTAKLDIRSRHDSLPLINGEVKIEDFRVERFSATETDLVLNSTKDQTSFELNLQKVMLNTASIDSVEIAGRLEPNNRLIIEKNNISMNEKKLVDLITGYVIIPYKSNLKKHEVNLTIDFTEDNSELLSMLHPNLKSVRTEGSFILELGGYLEDATLNMPDNSIERVQLTFANSADTLDSLVIDKPSITIRDNNIDLERVLLKQYNGSVIKDSLLPKNEFNFSGKIKLENLNLLDTSTLVLRTDIKAIKQKLVLQSPLYKGNISIENLQFKGPVLVSASEDDYKKRGLALPNLLAKVTVSDARVGIPDFSKKSQIFPLVLNTELTIGEDVYMSGQIVGDIFGIGTDLEFSPTLVPIQIKGKSNAISLTNGIYFTEGSLSIINRNFELLNAFQQQMYSRQAIEDILDNKIEFLNALEDQGYLAPNLSLRALTVIDNNLPATSNETARYTHVVMSINDNLLTLKDITFDVFDSEFERANSASDLQYRKQYKISTDGSESELRSKEEVAQLFEELFPVIFRGDIQSEELLTDIGTTQFNAYIRRSILRPFEKKLAKQVGFDDIKIDYNLGQKLIEGEDDVIGVQFIRRLVSDRLLLRLNTSIDIADTGGTAKDPFELSEVELTYYLFKKRNLSLNYTNYKADTTEINYNNKFSMRAHYDY